jgi:hypothetical protein
MSYEHNLYKFSFKEVYTGKQQYYSFEPDISISKFIEEVVLRTQLEFNLCHDEDFEIIEAGQFDNINGRDAELAPALEPSNNITIRQKYENNYKNIAFYIRRIPRVIY